MKPAFIGIDWGSTTFRAYLAGADGSVGDRIDAKRGILQVENGAFDAAYRALLAPWLDQNRELPVLFSGMIGSRQGWIEVPYVRCPAGVDELAQGLVAVPGLTRSWIVPGLDARDETGMPEVMRSEETQAFGAAAALGRQDGLFVLPGTHSKWVTLARGRITRFQTFITGEVYAALKGHTILGRLMVDGEGSGEGFERGVRDAPVLQSGGALLNRLFAVRTLGLTGDLPGSELADYLSGLLIGAEVLAASSATRGPVTIAANTALTRRYGEAATLLGLAHERAPDDCIVHGLAAIARAAKLI